MGRERRVWNRVLIALLATIQVTIGCQKTTAHQWEETDINIILSGDALQTRAVLPDEEKISDVNILVFNTNGELEKSIYSSGGITCFQITLLKNQEYTFTALINFGIKISVDTIEELDNISCHLAYPDEYQEGIPMYVKPIKHIIGSQSTITLNLTRLMSKISLRIDRSRLSDQVSMNVTGVRIGNCPKRMKVYSTSMTKSEDDCFSLGFSHDGYACAGLNRSAGSGLSETISVYMLENMQGDFQEGGISEDRDKVFDESDPRIKTCSYIEMDFDYISNTWISKDQPLQYRFYLGENRNDLNIERNCHYKIVVCPNDDGIQGDGWRVNKSGLSYVGETMLQQYPSDYIIGNIGDKIHIGCILTPAETPFDIGLDYLEFDRKRGIYEYEIDKDGYGVTLTLTAPGTGLIYMEAGSPIDDTALFLIEVNQPQ